VATERNHRIPAAPPGALVSAGDHVAAGIAAGKAPALIRRARGGQRRRCAVGPIG